MLISKTIMSNHTVPHITVSSSNCSSKKRSRLRGPRGQFGEIGSATLSASRGGHPRDILTGTFRIGDNNPGQPMTSATPPMTRAARIGLTVLLAGYGLIIITNPDTFRLIDNVDLAIHETGHLFFGPFGEFFGSLGGTAFQLIVPATFVGYFLYHGDRYAAAVLLWWVAQNCWNISVYMKDARSQLLPLVGGGEHDWAYLFSRLGWLDHDRGIAQATFVVGVMVFVTSIVWSARNVGSRTNGD